MKKLCLISLLSLLSSCCGKPLQNYNGDYYLGVAEKKAVVHKNGSEVKTDSVEFDNMVCFKKEDAIALMTINAFQCGDSGKSNQPSFE